MNSMYRKLLNLKRAALKPRPVTGEEVILFFSADAEDLQKIPLPVTIRTEKGKKRTVKVTEARLIRTFIREGEKGLERLVEAIIAAKSEIERELAVKGVLKVQCTRERVETVMRQTGFSTTEELMECLFRLLIASSEFLGVTVLSEKPLKARRGVEMPFTVQTISDIYGLIPNADGRHVKLTAASSREGELILLPVSIRDERDGSLLYREPVGIDVSAGTILRGRELLSLVADALENLIAAESETIEEPLFTFQFKAAEQVKSSIMKLLDSTILYIDRLGRLGLRNPEDIWLRPQNVRAEVGRPFAKIRLMKVIGGIKPKPEISEEEKRAVEEEAVRIVMEIERGEGRIPSVVPESEHYDVKSVDPKTGDVRKIEVKGHRGLEIYGELTDDEAELARRERDKYWLYIVYDIASGKPKYVRFRNPIETMNWRKFEKVKTETRYVFWPKEGRKK